MVALSYADQGIVGILVQATNAVAVISLFVDLEIGAQKRHGR
jgi:hypothetical protein